METEETDHRETNVRTVRCSDILLKGLTFLRQKCGVWKSGKYTISEAA